MSEGVLAINDGTTRIDLLKLFRLEDWTPAIADPKGGGTWLQSPFSQGRRLVLHEYENIVDTFNLIAIGNGDQNALIRNTQDLRRLLEKAVNYWIADWQNEPVWIEVRGICEENTRYAIISDYRIPNDDNPFSYPYVSNSAFEGFTLILEHTLWMDNEPLTYTALEIGASESYDGRNLGNVDSGGTFTPTTSDEVYVANKRNVANITDIYYWDVSAGAWSGNLMVAGFPFAFMPPAPLQVGDFVIFGIDSTLANSGPFYSLIFDIGTALGVGGGITIEWRYSRIGADPAVWLALTLSIQDYTNANGAMTGDAFDTTGVNSVVWETLANWTAYNPQVGAGPVLGVTGLWVCAYVTAAAGAPTPPTQQNRDIYSVIWPYVDLADTEISGDIYSLAQSIIKNYSDKEGSPRLYQNRVILGQRSLDRGVDFSAYINIADIQMPTGVTAAAVTDSAFAAEEKGPPGRSIHFLATLPIYRLSTRITIASSVSQQYEGQYRLLLRYKLGVSTDEFDIYCTIALGSTDNIIQTTKTVTAEAGTNAYARYLDLGIIEIPSNHISSWESIYFAIWVRDLLALGGMHYLALIDLILMPVDEVVIDNNDLLSLVNNSLGRSPEHTGLNFGSILNPKKNVEAYAFNVATGTIRAAWLATANSRYYISSNKDLRIWYFSGTDISAVNASEPVLLHRVMIKHTQQYLGMRGSR